MEKRSRKVTKFRKKRSVNAGMLTFIAIVIYLTASMVIYMARDKISFYEVVYGQNATAANKSYQALIVRDENVVYANEAGYINFYLSEGGRAALDSVVYSVDENGDIAELLEEYQSNNEVKLSDKDVKKINNYISNYLTSYNDMNFDEVYDFKSNLDATVLDYINTSVLENLNNIAGGNSTLHFNMYKPEQTGIVAFYTDGFESFIANSVSVSDFDLKNYKKSAVKANTLIAQGSPVYKIVNSEEWHLLIKLSEDEYRTYMDKTSLKIKLLDNDVTCVGKFSAFLGNDGGYYGRITLDKYMSEFISERYTEIKIVENQTTGLKIPKSAVVEKEYYIIPASFVGKGGNSNSEGFFKQIVTESGEFSIEFIAPDIYYKTDEYYYVSMEDFSTSDVIVMNDSSSVYQIGQTGYAKGVYNINNGYCIFKIIDIIGETSDYYIVADGTSHGLVVYDHIVLEGSMVEEDQVIFKVD